MSFDDVATGEAPMPRCLWIGRHIPYPADAGDKIYSAKLAESLAAAGATVRFMGFGTTDPLPAEAKDVEWVSVPNGRGSEIAALFTRLPNAAAIDATQAYRDMLESQLRESWDAIVLDGYGTGWALDRCLAYCYSAKPQPVLVHVSHNHETAIWDSMAADAQASFPKKLALRHNAVKVRALERRIVRNVSLLSTITDEDRAALLSVVSPESAPRALTLTPGYAGPVVAQRHIGPQTPRRVAIVGSFRWIVKQENLRRFVEVADPVFASHGISLDVIGDVPERLRADLKPHTAATQFHGYVEDPAEALAQARIAIVPEMFGGGFKLKFLDYIFARVPVATVSAAAAGLPDSLLARMFLRDDINALVDAIVENIDRFDELNERQSQAFELAQSLYRWIDRGVQLRDAILQILATQSARVNSQ